LILVFSVFASYPKSCWSLRHAGISVWSHCYSFRTSFVSTVYSRICCIILHPFFIGLMYQYFF
jgi:hypothetical protein